MSTMVNTICAIRIAGTPYLNFLCCVLWCHTRMPSNAPILPPKTAHHSKVDSCILHLDRLALRLSMPYRKNVTILTVAR